MQICVRVPKSTSLCSVLFLWQAFSQKGLVPRCRKNAIAVATLLQIFLFLSRISTIYSFVSSSSAWIFASIRLYFHALQSLSLRIEDDSIALFYPPHYSIQKCIQMYLLSTIQPHSLSYQINIQNAYNILVCLFDKYTINSIK